MTSVQMFGEKLRERDLVSLSFFSFQTWMRSKVQLLMRRGMDQTNWIIHQVGHSVLCFLFFVINFVTD